MRALPLLLAAAASAEWVEWPAGQAVPEGAATRININTNAVEVDVDINATLLEHRYRTSVNEATRAEDTTANLTRRETMISALKRLPHEEVGDVDALTDDALDALWSDRQESLRKWSEQLSDAAQSLQNRLAALLRDDEKAKLEALDELCVSVSRRVDGVEVGAVTMSHRWRWGGASMASKRASQSTLSTLDDVGAAQHGEKPPRERHERGSEQTSRHAGTSSSPTSTTPRTSTTRSAAGRRSRASSRRTRQK